MHDAAAAGMEALDDVKNLQAKGGKNVHRDLMRRFAKRAKQWPGLYWSKVDVSFFFIAKPNEHKLVQHSLDAQLPTEGLKHLLKRPFKSSKHLLTSYDWRILDV